MLFGYNRHTNYTQRDCVHKISALLLPIFIISLTGCEDKKPDKTPIPIENTTEFFIQKDKAGEEDKRFKLGKKKDEIADELPKVEISAPEKDTDVFTLINTKGESLKVTLSSQKVIFQQNQKPIVIVNLFATWCLPCIGEIAYLNDLQKKHPKELFITGILTHDAISQPALDIFMSKHQTNYFISSTVHNDAFASLLASTLHLPKNFSIPLTVIYVKGEYFTHYEGAVPAEMIEYDIQQAKKQLKSR